MSDLAQSHTPLAIKERLERGPSHRYLRDFIYGGIDGAITTFAIVSGVVGAGLSARIIVILGLANLFADGLSMAVSNFLGTRAEAQIREKARREEELHITAIPHGEREEIRQIFARKGFGGDELEKAVDIITSDRRRWIDMMMQDEHGLTLVGPSALKAGVATFAAFVTVGLVPLAVFLFAGLSVGEVSQPFLWSSVLTGVALFVVGMVKAPYVAHRWYVSGFETLVLGGLAAAVAYAIGLGLKGFH